MFEEFKYYLLDGLTLQQIKTLLNKFNDLNPEYTESIYILLKKLKLMQELEGYEGFDLEDLDELDRNIQKALPGDDFIAQFFGDKMDEDVPDYRDDEEKGLTLSQICKNLGLTFPSSKN